MPGLRQTDRSRRVIPCGFPDWAGSLAWLGDEELRTFRGKGSGGEREGWERRSRDVYLSPLGEEDSSRENKNSSLSLLRTDSPRCQAGLGPEV